MPSSKTSREARPKTRGWPLWLILYLAMAAVLLAAGLAVQIEVPEPCGGTPPVETGGHGPEPCPGLENYGTSTGPAPASLPLTLFFFFLLLSTGVGLLSSSSRISKATGATLAVTAALLSGMKLLSIDKLFATKDLLSFHYAPKYIAASAAEPLPFSREVKLPDFPSGTAEPTPELRCFATTLAITFAEDPQLATVMVVGRADRQELSAKARHVYASNWGLAQQRGTYIGNLLGSQIPQSKILVTNAGPLYTGKADSPRLWPRDRAVTVTAQGTDGPHSWTQAIDAKGEWRHRDCSLQACREVCQ